MGIQKEQYVDGIDSNPFSLVAEYFQDVSKRKCTRKVIIVDACLAGGFAQSIENEGYIVLSIEKVGERIQDITVINWATWFGIPILTLDGGHFFGYVNCICLRQKSIPEMVKDAKYALKYLERVS